MYLVVWVCLEITFFAGHPGDPRPVNQANGCRDQTEHTTHYVKHADYLLIDETLTTVYKKKRTKAPQTFLFAGLLNGTPKGIRTPVVGVKGRCPRPG